VERPSQSPRGRRRPFAGTVFGLCLLIAGTLTVARAQARTGAASGAPTATIASSPSSPTTSTTGTVAFVVNGTAEIKCSLDGASFVMCTSPVKYKGLAIGGHSFVVRATRRSLTATASAGWQIVAAAQTPPTGFSVGSSITDGATLAGALVWDARPSKPVSKVEFYVDGTLRWTEAFAPYLFNGDPDGLLDTSTLSDGSHVLKLVAMGTDGTRSEASAAVRVSNGAPSTPPPTTPPPTTAPPPTTTPTGGAGDVRFVQLTSSSTDTYTNSPTAEQQQWMRDHWQRGVVYSTYWDSRNSWYPNAWVYLNAYAIYNPSALATQHPDWILKDATGNKLYIPWGCSGGTCPQYAADVGDPDFRQYYIALAKAKIALGYKGIFMDDVDMDIGVGNGSGQQVAPLDRRTGQPMTDEAWKGYFAEFMEQVRSALPGVEIAHNAVWFAGGGQHDASNPYIAREVRAADYVNMERGFNDSGLTGGTGVWSVYALMRYVDMTHSYGAHVVLQSNARDLTAAEYNLAGYFLVNDGNDLVSTTVGGLPGQWWSGYDTDLGDATSGRYLWNGVWRRDFTGGFVLLNEPGASTKSLDLGGTFTTTSAQQVSNVTLGAARGAVLRR
jgi:putative glycosyl hydrolase-like family 15 (GHL15) protein